MGDNMIRIANFEMLRAMYDFKATFAKTLSFRENEHFILYQTTTKQRNWWQVVNDKGQIGFVPSNYVTSVLVAPQHCIQFLDNCIKVLKAESSKSGLSSDKQELILRLAENKRQAEDSYQKIIENSPQAPAIDCVSPAGAPPLLFHTDSGTKVTSNKSSGDGKRQSITKIPQVTSSDSNEESIKSVDKKEFYQSTNSSAHSLPDVSQRHDRSDASSSVPIEGKYSDKNISESGRNVYKTSSMTDSRRSSCASDVSSKAVYELVETVRKNTQLSHEMSRIAVATVIDGLQELLPTSFTPYLANILSHVEGPLMAPKRIIEQTHDATRLKVIFTELTSCKEDSQQRSWMLHEDESIIKEYILELISILSNADASISKHVMSNDQYQGVTTLIQYYQMEVRWSIRQLLLQAFGIMCSLDNTAVNIILNSVLPMELARDMVENPRNMPKLNYSSLLLTMVFSMGEPMPITHLEQLGVNFIEFLFDLMESPPDTDVDEQIPDLFLNLVLSFNLQYPVDSEENVVMQALGNIEAAKTFTEKILLLLNREEDPVRIFDHQPAPPHSVLKLFIDLFSREKTASLFYTNDTKVLIDIIVRQLSDLSAGDLRRQQYLELCRRLIKNTNYEDHMHRRDDILKCFTRIFCEETEQSQSDQQLVRSIINEFPQYFKE